MEFCSASMEATKEVVVILCSISYLKLWRLVKCKQQNMTSFSSKLSTKRCCFLKTMVLRSQDDSVVFPRPWRPRRDKQSSACILQCHNKCFGRKMSQLWSPWRGPEPDTGHYLLRVQRRRKEHQIPNPDLFRFQRLFIHVSIKVLIS